MDLSSENSEPLSLLYVEDEFDARTLLSSMIETKFPALQLYTAGNGKEGLASYTENHVDILLTDISMPYMDGMQMARNIKKLNKDVMIIVLTARTDTQYLLDSIDIGINQYVLKPINHQQLFAALNKCIDAITVRRTVKSQYDCITQLNARLLDRTNELEMLNRELEAFNYTVSHDLRTPLTVIHGYCQVLQELFGSYMDADCRGYIKEILNGVHHMKDLIAALLNFSKINRSELTISNVDLSEIAVEICHNFSILNNSDRRVSFQIAEGIRANGDKVLLKVLLENLLGNSWKYTATKENAVIAFGIKENKKRSLYYVQDNGVGFDSKCSDRIFAPFQRLDNSEEFEGTGIGLATVKRIIQRHGGEIWAEGKIGEGATFYFTLQK